MKLPESNGSLYSVEAVLSEAGLFPRDFWLYLGYDALAFYHPAEDSAREQLHASGTDPGPQQEVHQGAGRRKQKCGGWALRGGHDSLR